MTTPNKTSGDLSELIDAVATSESAGYRGVYVINSSTRRNAKAAKREHAALLAVAEAAEPLQLLINPLLTALNRDAGYPLRCKAVVIQQRMSEALAALAKLKGEI